ncbi:MAG: GMC oxidoreductase [Acidimicrobiales bacterium]
MERPHYDVVIVGSGFGGSVAALRLAEKGYRVGVLEAGRRFDPWTLPRTSWDLRHFLWAPWLFCFGLQRVHLLPDALVLAGAGVGGGSLNYANTLYEPLPAFYEGPQWAFITDWRSELAPYYDQARRMLGAVDNPTMTPSDEAMVDVARQMGALDSFRAAPVGVWFGPPGAATAPGAAAPGPGQLSPDPFFGGAGPARQACKQCGECMTGCRYGAKNTLLVNYLYLAERAGAEVMPLRTVRSLEPLAEGGWEVEAVPTGPLRLVAPLSRRVLRLRAEHVVLAAGAFGTQKLLHSMVLSGRLPRLSARLGELTRTNSESLLGAVAPRRRARGLDFTRGVAITSSFYPEPGTHVEPVRYGRGSNMMGLFAAPLVEAPQAHGRGRWVPRLSALLRHPMGLLASLDLRGWSERTVIALVMQSKDNSLVVSARRGRSGRAKLTSEQGYGEPNPVWLPVGHEVARRLAARIGARPASTWGEIFGMPMTAHFLGGCAIGASADDGVVDPWHRAFGYPGLHIVDGSAVPANPGANPALTIAAMAERAMAYWPNRGEQDPRPPLGSPYERVAPVAPRDPVVPDGAPGALRLVLQ